MTKRNIIIGLGVIALVYAGYWYYKKQQAATAAPGMNNVGMMGGGPIA